MIAETHHSKSGGQTRRAWRLVVAAALTAVTVAAVERSVSAPADRGSQRDSAPAILFGVIEPPVVAQRDITIRTPTANQQPEPKPIECSGMAWADGKLLLSSDRHEHVLFTCPVDLKTMTIGTLQPHILIRNEQKLFEDAESLTLHQETPDRWVGYAMCSMSNDERGLPLPKRRSMLRFTLSRDKGFQAGPAIVLDVSPLRDALHEHLQAAGAKPYATYHAATNKNTYRWGNVEGMTLTPDGKRMLFGLRNPLLNDKALLFVVDGIEEAFQTRYPGRLWLLDVFALDLGQRGVSGLCWDPVTKGYLIAAGKSNGPKVSKDQPFPPNSLDCALFWWSGRKTEKPRLIARMPDMKIEAVCRLGDSRYVAVCSDEGDVSEGRPRRQQSVLTLFEFTGIAP